MKRRIELNILTLVLLVGTVAGQATATLSHRTKTSGPGGVQEALVVREEGFWDARKNKRASFFEQNLADESMTVGFTGNKKKREVVEELEQSNCTLKDYSLRDFTTTILARNTFLLTYRVNQQVTCAGKALPAGIYATSIYVQRGDAFRLYFHQETAGPQ